MPYLGGKAVRPRTAIIPASLVAVLVFTAGLHGVRAQLLGYYPEDSGLGEENWGTTAPGLLWPIWEAALARRARLSPAPARPLQPLRPRASQGRTCTMSLTRYHTPTTLDGFVADPTTTASAPLP